MQMEKTFVKNIVDRSAQHLEHDREMGGEHLWEFNLEYRIELRIQ